MDSFTIDICSPNLRAELPQPLNVSDYEVALTKLTVPAALKNFKAMSFLHRTSEGALESKVITPGFLSSIDALIYRIRETIRFDDDISISFDQYSQFVRIETTNSATIQLKRDLADVLRMPEGRIRGVAKSSGPVELSRFNPTLVISWDAVERSQYNNKMISKLLVSKFEDSQGLQINAPVYYRFQTSTINNIDINIYLDTGEEVNFFNNNILATLNFRKKLCSSAK